jgi:hypothetical protein
MPSYTISKKRIDYIREHFFQWAFRNPEGFLPSKDDFLKLDHPADLHYLAYIYNWDDGTLVLEWMLDSPLCTRSTANLVFWRSAPDDHLQYALNDLETCNEYYRNGIKVLSKIVDKYSRNDFSTYQIEFDPTNEIEKVTEKNPKWTFPSGVYDKIKGVEILCEE